MQLHGALTLLSAFVAFDCVVGLSRPLDPREQATTLSPSAQRRALLPSGLDGDDPYVRWTALKENWWQPFTDGFQHSANTVGKTPDGYPVPQVTWNGNHSTPAGELVPIHRAYAEFLGSSDALSQAWNHDRLYALSNIAFGSDPGYTCHFPRKDEARVKALAPGAVTDDPIFKAISNWEPPDAPDTAGCNFEHVSAAPSYPLWRRYSPIPRPAARRPTHPATPPPHALRSPAARSALASPPRRCRTGVSTTANAKRRSFLTGRSRSTTRW